MSSRSIRGSIIVPYLRKTDPLDNVYSLVRVQQSDDTKRLETLSHAVI